MTRLANRIIALLIAILLMATPSLAITDNEKEFEDPQVNAAYIVGDAIIARPVGLVMTVAGFGLFIISSPFALISKSAGKTWDGLVVYPAKFTFTRPMGEFE